MSTYCDRLQRFLVEQGPAALGDDTEAQQHLVDCNDCFDFLEALEHVDTTLARMPEHDAPASVVENTMAAVRGAALPETQEPASPEVEETPESPSRWLQLSNWGRRVLFGLLTAISLAPIRRWLARPAENDPRPRWRRLVTNPAFVAPVAGVPMLLVVSTAVLLVTHGAPERSKGGDSFAKVVLQAETPSEDLPLGASDHDDLTGADMPTDESEPDTQDLGRPTSSPGSVSLFPRGGTSGKVKKFAEDRRHIPFAALDANADDSSLDQPDEQLPSPAPATPRVVDATELPSSSTGPSAYRDKESHRRGQETDRASEELAATRSQFGSSPDLPESEVSQTPESEREREIVVSRSELDVALGGVATQARIVPTFKNGEATGFKLFSIRPDSALGKAGLRNGDVVQRINGRDLTSPDQALETYNALKDGESLAVDLERDGRPLTMKVVLDSSPEAHAPALAFVRERQRTARLRFQSPDGYWVNTYVPGDPALRLLANRLRRADRDLAGNNLRLDRAARQYAQPFDHPTTSALDVFLQADRAGIQEPTRMLVQVGIQGTPRRSRSRPAMNVGVVLDLSETPTAENAAAMRALVMALTQARDIGDRFSLVVAGRPGGVLVEAAQFKHGAVTVAMRSLFSDSSAGPSLDLRQAMETAVGLVVGADDPTTPLGSSVVLMITPNRIPKAVLGPLTQLVHYSAVNGVPASVVGVGAGVDLDELDRLTLAGQGNRRLLTSAAEAEGVVERELSAVSRVIARAVRVRIRLAPGVKLVDVIGSHRLGEERAERVRQAEQSIDRRMSRNLGLESDRGDDEDGIQMVIPSYYAGDTHVILLDVVAPNAGPIADVRVRYKDLVYLKNGVARANLTLHRRPRHPGPLQLNVTKNLLAREVSTALRRAGDLLHAGEVSAAESVLREHIALLTGLGRELPGLAGDRDLGVDIAMLGEYAAVLAAGASGPSRDLLVDSLRYAAFLKILPRPSSP